MFLEFQFRILAALILQLWARQALEYDSVRGIAPDDFRMFQFTIEDTTHSVGTKEPSSAANDSQW